MGRNLYLGLMLFGFALPGLAQLDSSALRLKYGSPLKRETFHMPSGFDLAVDYGASNQVCKLEVPALMPTNEKVSNSDEMNRSMYEFLAELVPLSMRGKELRRMTNMMSTISLLTIEYERVTVSEFQYANRRSGANTITLKFNGNCQ